MASSVDPDYTAPSEAAWSRTAMFVRNFGVEILGYLP